MRTLGMATILLGLTLPRAASADVFKVHVSGNAAFLTFDQVSSSGGCTTETSGQLLALDAHNDPDLQDVVVLLGARVVTCSDGSSSYASYAAEGTGTFSGSGLSSASLSASLQELSTGEPISINVTWSGTGTVSTMNERFFSSAGGVTLDFVHQRSRGANLSGSVTLGGAGASIANGTLFNECDGDLVVIH